MLTIIATMTSAHSETISCEISFKLLGAVLKNEMNTLLVIKFCIMILFVVVLVNTPSVSK